MKNTIEIYKQTFRYKGLAVLVIVYNLLFVIFNLLSMVLFIPFLQLIFPESSDEIVTISKPVFDGTFSGGIRYVSEYYNYFTQSMVAENPKNALLFVCCSVLIAFFLKNLFRYGAIWHQSELRMAVVRDVRQNLFNKAMSLPLSYYSNERKGDVNAEQRKHLI